MFKLGSSKGLNALFYVMNEENTILWCPSESKYIYYRSVATFDRTAQKPTSPLKEIHDLFSVFVAVEIVVSAEVQFPYTVFPDRGRFR